MKEHKSYSDADNARILEMKAGGYPVKEIANTFGRTEHAMREHIRVLGHRLKREAVQRAIADAQNEIRPAEKMTPRDMIRSLYRAGYRIENNKLVCYQKIEVKLEDIIRE